MRSAQEQLVARMESAALGLEGLVARVAELRAMATDAGVVDPTDADLASLTTEVEGLRQGLVEERAGDPRRARPGLTQLLKSAKPTSRASGFDRSPGAFGQKPLKRPAVVADGPVRQCILDAAVDSAVKGDRDVADDSCPAR